MGGIGTGTIGLGGRGDLRDFEVGNFPAKGFRPGVCFFALSIGHPDGARATRLLEGPLEDDEFEGPAGSMAANQGLPRFERAEFDSAYPFGAVTLTEPGLPRVTIGGFNPMIFTDLDASSLPVAIIRIEIENLQEHEISVGVAAAVENFIGANGRVNDIGGNINTLSRDARQASITLSAPSLPDGHEAAGVFTMSVAGEEDASITHRTGWLDAAWGGSLLDFWDDFAHDGALEERTSSADRPVASLCRSLIVGAGETRTVTFVLAWRFPYRRAWDYTDSHIDQGDYSEAVVGNHYASRFQCTSDTIDFVWDHLPELEERTAAAVRTVLRCSTPDSLKEAALFNLSTLRSQTLFRTIDGRFFGWEGVMKDRGSCFGTCTHVWGYEFATSSLFPQIARSFRETQYLLATDERGFMPFRVGLPLESLGTMWPTAAADGQMACLVHLYYDWKLSGDTAALLRLWAPARRSLEFAWCEGGWDADMDGVMEGCQHNTMDVEYYGPNPQMGSWYLAALQASAEMALALGDLEFADTCRRLFNSGSAWMDKNLFNGEYYEHQVALPTTTAKGLRLGEGPKDGSVPDLQLGQGILIDQLVGQYASRIVGLAPVLDERHIRTTLDKVFSSNFRENLGDHFNHMRGFALGDESAVLMCTYPDGTRPDQPFPYFNEVMTGFEYTLAAGLIQEGNRAAGERIVSSVRNRYDGKRRNPYDEAECGRHYARALASWSAFTSWLAIEVNGVRETMRIASSAGEEAFWSSGSSFGTVEALVEGGIVLKVEEGELTLEQIWHSGHPFLSERATFPVGHHALTVKGGVMEP